MQVTAAEAAYLVDRHERIVRWHLSRGDIPGAVKDGNTWRIEPSALEQVAGWKVDPRRLAELSERDAKTAASMAARIEALEARVRALEAQIRALQSNQSANSPYNASRGDSDGLAGLDSLGHRPAAYTPSAEPVTRSYALRYTAPSSPGTFATRADAARWLMRHGINAEGTPKSWPGWRSVRLEPEDVLRLAIAVYDPGNWRITWRLHRCDDTGCVCADLLEA